MFPFVSVLGMDLPANAFMLAATFGASYVIVRIWHPVWPWPKCFAAVVWVGLAALGGAYLLGWAVKLYTSHFGRVFYGAMAGGCAAVAVWPHAGNSRENWRTGFLCLATGYGILRVGCFANGCCYGRLATVPWAVQFTADGTGVPMLGVPLHPVQLYDSALGFFLAGWMWISRSKGGPVSRIFLVGFPIGRLVTESFRGDSIRGVDLWLGLSTSQLISAGLLVGLVLAIGIHSKKGETQLHIS